MTDKTKAMFNRFGRYLTSLGWTIGTEQTAPAGNTTLVTKTVTAGKVGYIYGFYINTQEANDFLIKWTTGASAKSKRITFGSQGAMLSELTVALNDALSADASTTITIENVNAGTAGKKYVADVLIGEAYS